MPGLIGIAVGAFSSLDNSVSAIGVSGRSATKVVGCCGSGKARILPSTSRCISSAIATKPRRDWLAVVRRKGRVASIAAGVMAWTEGIGHCLLNHCTAKVQAVYAPIDEIFAGAVIRGLEISGLRPSWHSA